MWFSYRYGKGAIRPRVRGAQQQPAAHAFPDGFDVRTVLMMYDSRSVGRQARYLEVWYDPRIVVPTLRVRYRADVSPQKKRNGTILLPFFGSQVK